MKIREIRRQNLAQLIKTQANNNQREFSELIGKPASFISQMINDTRGMGEKVARDIEDSLGIEKYFLDKSPAGTGAAKIEEPASPQYISPKSRNVLNRLHRLAESKALTDDDFALIDQLADRFQSEKGGEGK